MLRASTEARPEGVRRTRKHRIFGGESRGSAPFVHSVNVEHLVSASTVVCSTSTRQAR